MDGWMDGCDVIDKYYPLMGIMWYDIDTINGWMDGWMR